ncbi:MAG: hypothetical protein PGN11_10730 [Quadrisphaera sp.]
MVTTLAAPATGAVGIAGDPAALYAAADEMSATARDYFNAADAIAAHGRAVTANWVGDASDAAGRHIATLATRVHVGSEVYTAAATAIRTYAGELAAAQDAWTAASVRAASASTALDRAHQQATAAAAMTTTGHPDPSAQAAQSLATDQAATAVTAASTALSNAQEDMAAAVANAAAANQRAADAITACCEQLAAMDGGPSTTSSQTLTQAPPWPSALAGATSTTAASYGATSATTPAQRDQSAWDGAVAWAEGAENWLEDNSGTIADVLGTAALISAFIPGVDLAVTPILGALSASAGLMAAHHAYADGDKAEGDQQILMAGLSIVPDGRLLGKGLQAGKALTEADDVADAARTAKGLSAKTTSLLLASTLTSPPLSSAEAELQAWRETSMTQWRQESRGD